MEQLLHGQGGRVRAASRLKAQGMGQGVHWKLVIAVAIACQPFGISLERGLSPRAAVAGDKAVAVKSPSVPAITVSADDLATLDRVSTAIHRVAESVKPSVVSIQTMNSRPAHRTSTSAGSGVIFDSTGYVVTSYHVVADSDRVDVQLHDGRSFKASVVGRDRMTDVALLKIKGDRLVAAKFGDSDKLDVGHLVLAIGSPFMLAQTVSHGIVSAKGRAGVNLNIDYQDFIQTDVPTNPGNSGGALVNTHGEVIGINTAIATESGSFAGVAFATPSNIVVSIAKRLMTGKPIVRGFLGVTIGPLQPELAEQFGLDTAHGVMIQNVQENSPAGRSGLQPEDVVIEVDGKKVRSVNELQVVIAALAPGVRSAFTVLREGKSKRIEVMVGEQPRNFSTHGMLPARTRESDDRNEPQTVRSDDEEGQDARPDERYDFDQLGMDAETLSPHLIKRFRLDGFEANGGVVITRLDPTGDAYGSNLREGDVFIAVDGQTVHTQSELMKALTTAKLKTGVRVRLGGQDGSRTLMLRAQ